MAHGVQRRTRGIRRVWFVSACSAVSTLIVVAAQTPAVVEWRSYAGDLRNHHYSPLAQVTAANFNTLEVAWRFKTDSLGPRPEYKLEGTPLVVNGVLYTTGGTRRAVVALDAATGELRWTHAEREGARAAASPRQLSGRGVALLDRRRATSGSSTSPPATVWSRSMPGPARASRRSARTASSI